MVKIWCGRRDSNPRFRLGGPESFGGEILSQTGPRPQHLTLNLGLLSFYVARDASIAAMAPDRMNNRMIINAASDLILCFMVISPPNN